MDFVILLLVVLVPICCLVWFCRWARRTGFFSRLRIAAKKTAITLVVGACALWGLATVNAEAASVTKMVTAQPTDAAIGAGVIGVALLIGFFRKAPPTWSTEPDSSVDSDPPQASASSVATPAEKGAVSYPRFCPRCRGAGQETVQCASCSGCGESKCYYSVKGRILGMVPWRLDCRGGRLFGNHEGHGEVSSGCNGRGFIRCSCCGGRGQTQASCSKCKGKGEL